MDFLFSILFLLVLKALVCVVSFQLLLLMTENDCGEGRVWGKGSLVVRLWLRSGEGESSDCSNVSSCVRDASKIRERTNTDYSLAGEDFQNRGTLIVVKSSVFVLSSVHNTQFARDAYNALWDSRRRSQERNCSHGFKIVRRWCVVFRQQHDLRRDLDLVGPRLVFAIATF